MTSLPTPGDPLASGVREQCFERFVAEWRADSPPNLAAYIAELSTDSRRSVLLELVRIDLERRWRCFGKQATDAFPQTPSVEDYVARYPELGAAEELPVEILVDEYHIRQRWGDAPSPESYCQRFPTRSAELTTLLGEASASEETVTVLYEPLLSTTVRPVSGEGRNVPSFAEPTPHERFGQYELLEEIARGGMGVVYKARQSGVNRVVALKMTLAGQFVGDEECQRFLAEAEAAGQLDHPNIVPIYEVGEHEGQPFFSMGFVEGVSLKHTLATGPLLPRQASELLKKIAEAVQYAHEKGIVHRDLKPANVLLDTSGQPRVTDFGLAKRTTADSELTATGQVLGTPSYMPPEQAAGKPEITPAADIYSLGAMLYCLLTGRPPFQAASVMDTLKQVLEKDPVPPRQLNGAIPVDLETICLKCLSKEPARRYASAGEFAEELQRFLDGRPIIARRVGSAERLWRWCRRNPGSAALVAMSVVVSVLGVVAWRFHEIASQKQAIADLQEFYLQVSQAQEASAGRETGWSWRALDALKRAAGRRPEKYDWTPLRTLAVACANSIDVRPVGGVAKGVNAGAYAFSPDGERLAVAEVKKVPICSVFVYNTGDRSLVRSYGVSTLGSNLGRLFTTSVKRFQDGFTTVAFSADGRWLAAGMRFGQIVVWDTEQDDDQPAIIAAHSADMHRLRFSPDCLKLWSSGGDSFDVKVWDVGPAGVKPVRTFADVGRDFDLSPDGRWVFTSNDDDHRKIRMFDTKTGQEQAMIRDGNPRGEHLVSSQNGRFLSAPWRRTAVLLFSRRRPNWWSETACDRIGDAQRVQDC